MLVCGDNQVTLRPRVMHPNGAPAPDILEAFTAENTLPADDLSEQRLVAALDMAFTPIETLVPKRLVEAGPGDARTHRVASATTLR